MQERPILFSGEMVKAILAGRKTQTRRVIKDYPWTRPPYYFCGLRNGLGYPASEGATWAGFTCKGYHSPCYVKCPYGKPNDLLWVREAWCPANSENGPVVCYRATYGRRYLVDECNPVDYSLYPTTGNDAWCAWAGDLESGTEGKWRSSIFMPRWASRISLRIEDVRVERLQEISESDSIAEGLVSWPSTCRSATHYGLTIADVWETDPRLTYKRLWNDINAKRGYSWDSNPWVWVIEFRRKI